MPAKKTSPAAKPPRVTAPRKTRPAATATAPVGSAPKPVADGKIVKPKLKLVRDSFAMPGDDFNLIQQLKDRALGFRRSAKKSELLRAGLHALVALSDARLRVALDSLAPLKPGRPKKPA